MENNGKDKTLYTGTKQDYEIGDIVEERCDICGGAMAFQHLHSQGYVLMCVVDPNLDHMEMLAPQDIV